jgi:hypothetical protein
LKLPNPDRAVVDEEKLARYCLNPFHHRGGHKARKFKSILGFTSADAPKRRQLLLRAAIELEAQLREQDEFGQRYAIDIHLMGTSGNGSSAAAGSCELTKILPA